MYKGIDISAYQTNIDWANVNVDFCIMRASIGLSKDSMVDSHVKGCIGQNIPYGFYHYLKATTASDAIKEANLFLSVIKDYRPTYPVIVDVEDKTLNGLSKTALTDIVIAFMQVLEDNNYYAMIYTNNDWYINKLDNTRLKKYDLWLAWWRTLKPKTNYNFGMWQRGLGTVKGFNAKIDVDTAYKDYPSIITKYGLNKSNELTKNEQIEALNKKVEELQTKINNAIKALE